MPASVDASEYLVRGQRRPPLQPGQYGPWPLPKAKPLPKLGDLFVSEHRDLFGGCNCKNGLPSVMNRWQRGAVGESQIAAVLSTLCNKNPEQSREDIEHILRSFIDAESIADPT